MYGILRLEKYKRSAVHGIQLERNRTKEDDRNFAYSDIDRERTEFNHQYITTEHWNKEITKQIKNAGVKERPDSVVMMGALVTASQEYFTLNPKYKEAPAGEDTRTREEKQKWLLDEKTKSFFDDGLQFVVDTYCGGDRGKVISAVLDMDEQTPHLQIYFVPLIERENRKGEKKMHLSAKDVMGNRNDLRRVQDQFHEQIGKPRGLERGEKVDFEQSYEERKKHTKTIDYKKQQNKLLEAENEDLSRQKQEYEKSIEEIKEKAQIASQKLMRLYGMVDNIEKELDRKKSDLHFQQSEYDEVILKLGNARIEIEHLEQNKTELEEKIRQHEIKYQEAKQKGSAEVEKMKAELSTMKSDYEKLGENVTAVRELNEAIDRMLRSTQKADVKRYKEYPAKKDLLGRETQPATSLVDTADLKKLEQQRLTPSVSWEMDKVFRQLQEIQSTLSGYEMEKLKEELEQSQREARTERQRANRFENLYKSIKFDLERVLERFRGDREVSQALQRVINDQEQEQTQTHHHGR